MAKSNKARTAKLKIHLPAPTPRAQGAPKMFDAVAIVGCRTAREANAFRGREHVALRHRRLPQVAPNRRQRRTIAACLAAVDCLLAAFGLPPSGIAADRIHIVSDGFNRVAGAANWKAYSYRGHCFLRASSCRRDVEMINILTHELAHLVSCSIAIIDGRMPRGRYLGHVSGLNCVMFDLKLMRQPFMALNEATTELCAHAMRQSVARALGLSKRSKSRLLLGIFRDSGYGPFIETLLRLLAPRRTGLRIAVRTLTNDYLHGTGGFLNLIRKRGLFEELFLLDADYDSLEAFVSRHK